MTQQEFEIFAQKQAQIWREKHAKDEVLPIVETQNFDKIPQREIKIIETPKKREHFLRVREVAKLISDNYNIEIGQNRLFDKMREWGLIIPHTTEPYQKAIREGWLVYLPKVVETAYGDKIVMWTKVTHKGTAYIMNKIRQEYSHS